MSFILDALKKSEAERQNQVGAGISNTPQARQRSTLPGWAVGLIAVLGLAVVGLGWAWWQAQRPATPVIVALPAPQPVAAAAGGPVRDLAAEARPADNLATTPAAAAPARSPSTAPAAAEALPASTTRQPAGAAAAGSVSAGLPSAADLAVQGIALPDMNLDIHVYSSKRTERFVFINSTKYREGERLRDGPRVEEITADGVILSYQGARFLLPRD
jgi:general secretion pathway protein B